MDVNEYFLRKSLWPTVVYVGLVMVVGTVGNIFVLIIYRHDCHKSVTLVFICFLAFIDLLCCLISMPTELTIIVNMMSFPSQIWCKISRYFALVFLGSSCISLMFIALNRYDSVCRSGKQWLNLTKAKRICVSIFTFACVFEFPALILYGEANVLIVIQEDTFKFITENMDRYSEAENRTQSEQTNGTNVTGRMCLISTEYSGGIMSMIFFCSNLFIYFTLVVLVIYFYTKVIGKMVAQRATQMRAFGLNIQEKKSPIQEQTFNNHWAEDIKSDILRKNVSQNRLSVLSFESNSPRRLTEINKPTTVDCKLKNKLTVYNKSDHGASSEQKLSEITFSVSDSRKIDSYNFCRSSNLAESKIILSSRIESVDTPSKSSNEDLRQPRRGIDIESTSKIESPDKPVIVCKDKSEDDIQSITITITEIESREYTCKSGSGNSESMPDKENGQMTNSEEYGPGAETSSVNEEEDAQYRPLSRCSYYDSTNYLFGIQVSPPTKTTEKKQGTSINTINIRTNTLLLSISLVFILSFVPVLSILLWRAVAGIGFLSSLNPVSFAVVTLSLRISFISSAVNPILYGLVNSKFRKSCKAIIARR